MSSFPADHLRARAQAIRGLAQRLQHLQVLSLGALASGDTWLGPTPQRCAEAMRATRTSLLDHADELLRTARRYERQADELAALPDPSGAR